MEPNKRSSRLGTGRISAVLVTVALVMVTALMVFDPPPPVTPAVNQAALQAIFIALGLCSFLWTLSSFNFRRFGSTMAFGVLTLVFLAVAYAVPMLPMPMP